MCSGRGVWRSAAHLELGLRRRVAERVAAGLLGVPELLRPHDIHKARGEPRGGRTPSAELGRSPPAVVRCKRRVRPQRAVNAASAAAHLRAQPRHRGSHDHHAGLVAPLPRRVVRRVRLVVQLRDAAALAAALAATLGALPLRRANRWCTSARRAARPVGVRAARVERAGAARQALLDARHAAIRVCHDAFEVRQLLSHDGVVAERAAPCHVACRWLLSGRRGG
eukprot:4844871-Prymnesium_polylepis.1